MFPGGIPKGLLAKRGGEISMSMKSFIDGRRAMPLSASSDPDSSKQGPATSEHAPSLRDARQFLQRAVDAENAALRTADPQQKRAWTDIALAWIQLAQSMPPLDGPPA
jgi:hypothetical protein